MKPNFSPKILLAIMVSLVTLSISCNKEESKEDENGTSTHEPFSVQFQNGYGKDYGWIVLHSSDGAQILDYKKYIGDAFIDFGNVETPLTATFINIDTITPVGKEIVFNVSISTDKNAPAGNWIFNTTSNSSANLGQAIITLSYPENDYSYLFTSCYGFTNSTYNINPTETNQVFDINYLDPTGDFSFFSYITSDDGSLCNWSLDNTFQTSVNNFYSLTLDNPLTEKIISTNMPLSHINLSAYWNQRDSYLRISTSNTTTQNHEYEITYPVGMPVDEMQLRAYNLSETHQAFYTQFIDYSTGMPDELIIPESGLSASFSSDNQKISNLQVTGNTDQIRGYWEYFNFDSGNLIYWNVYAEKSVAELTRPELPQEILNDIGSLVNQMESKWAAMTDYNTTESHTDIINRFFIQNVPINQRYDESYVYYYGNDKKTLTIEEQEILYRKLENR